MAKLAAVSAISVCLAIVCFCGPIVILMHLGTKRFDNYEYYGQYPILYVGPGIAGFVLPWIVFWIANRTSSSKPEDKLADNDSRR